MSVRNKYILKLHYNKQLGQSAYNNDLKHAITSEGNLITLYDEEFAGSYVPDKTSQEKTSLYGSLTPHGCYSFVEDLQHGGRSIFEFFTIYPEKIKMSKTDSVKFAFGNINNITGSKLYFQSSSDGNGLVLLHENGNSMAPTNWNFNHDYTDPKTTKDYSVLNAAQCTFSKYNSCEKLIIPKSDIDDFQGIKQGMRYVIEASAASGSLPVEIYEDHSGIKGAKIGTLKSSTILATFSQLGQPKLSSLKPSWETNPSSQQVDKLVWKIKELGQLNGDYITLYRDKASGVFKYYFSNKNGHKTSDPHLQPYCEKPDNCKMEDVNFFPNIETYLKSTLVSAEIGDFSGQRGVDAAGVAAVLQNSVVKRVARVLVTTEADQLGQVLLHTASGTLRGKTITEYLDQDMPKNIAQKPAIQQAVATELRNNPGNARGPEGPPGQDGVNGAPGLQGIQGPRGLGGPAGQNGRDADPAQVAEELVTNKAGDLGKVLLETSSVALGNKTITDYVNQDMSQEVVTILKKDPSMKGPPGRDGINGARGPAGQNGNDGRDADPVEVTHRLAHNTRFKRSLKGEDGADGERGENGTPGLAGPEGRPGKSGAEGPRGPEGPKGDSEQDGTGSEIAYRLAHNTRLKRSLKGDDGADGERGEQGRDGKQGEKGEQGKRGEQGEKGEQGERGEQGEKGKDGVDNSLPLDSGSKKPQLKIVPGDTNGNIQKANIELEKEEKSVVIATFLEIGYFFKNDDLYIRDHITGNNILIPKSFHYLAVIKDDVGDYKLAFCNNLGNLFFDHKKYASEYASVPKEYGLIDLKYIKNPANINLSEYYFHTHTPLFIVRRGELEGQSLENYRVDVYEMARNKKIGTLVDEFGFFEDDQFHYVHHHQGYEHHSQELSVRIENHEGNLQIGDHIIHPIILDDHLNSLDYLGYS